MVKCKFKCTEKTENINGIAVKMEPVTYGSKENEEFFKYTPYGSLIMGTINKEAANQLEIGKDYYLDITPAE